MMKFTIEQVPPFYQGYITKVMDMDLLTALNQSETLLTSLCENLTESQSLYRYEESKWSIKDLVQHLIDSERVFAYRSMRFARNDQTPLSGFEHDDYVASVVADKFAMSDLIHSFKNIRRSTIDLFSSFSESELIRSGVANGVEMTVEMIGYVICGHTRHHTQVIQEKYL